MYLLIGLLAGVFGSLVGMGGGAVMIPLLTGVMGMEQQKAHGTSLFTLVFTGITGMLVYLKFDAVDFRAAEILALAAVITVRFGVKFAASLPSWKLKRAFGWLLCFVAMMLPLKSLLVSSILNPSPTGTMLILLTAGAFTGFLSGMLGVGGGSIMTPVMVLLIGIDQHTAQGTSLLAMIPIGIAAAYEHWKIDMVSKKTLPYLVPAIIVGSVVGGYMAHNLPEFTLKLVFAAVLLWTGAKYIKTTKPEAK